MTVFSPPYNPSFGARQQKKYRMLENKFGDGYEQGVQDGLNNIIETWELAWNNINDTDCDSIVTALDALAGLTFEWTTPQSVTKNFRCTSFDRSYVGFQSNNLTATFTEAFDT